MEVSVDRRIRSNRRPALLYSVKLSGKLRVNSINIRFARSLSMASRLLLDGPSAESCFAYIFENGLPQDARLFIYVGPACKFWCLGLHK